MYCNKSSAMVNKCYTNYLEACHAYKISLVGVLVFGSYSRVSLSWCLVARHATCEGFMLCLQ